MGTILISGMGGAVVRLQKQVNMRMCLCDGVLWSLQKQVNMRLCLV